MTTATEEKTTAEAKPGTTASAARLRNRRNAETMARAAFEQLLAQALAAH